jgi:hypothetical protein
MRSRTVTTGRAFWVPRPSFALVLGNVFAGLQIAFSDAIRLDDVVIVEDEWGRVEEITLTYLVVHLWDDRRLVGRHGGDA